MTGKAAGTTAIIGTAASQSSPSVTIQDRRTLPFFQVRLHGVHAIRGGTSGPRRLRAIGFYALLCQLANEQRHMGEHRVVRITYETLAERGQMSKRSVKLLLDALESADVIRYERRNDRATGSVISLLHLLIQDEPWIALTVAMAEHLATPRRGGHLLRDLGLIVVLLEFCTEQRMEHGGLTAEVMRADIATRSGVTVDRVDDCNHVLERAGLLEITRRRAANGGRHLPSVYTIREVPSAADQGGGSTPRTRRNGTASPAQEYEQGGAVVPAAAWNGTGSPEHGNWAGGKTATGITAAPPSIARAGEGGVEEGLERIPPSGNALRVEHGGGPELSDSPEELCELLLSAWEPILGDSPRHEFAAHRGQWLTAGTRLLSRHPRDRLETALAYMVTDEILGSQALSMPGFAKVADQLIARAYARRLRHGAPRISSLPGRPPAPAWAEARQALQRAIQRHGRDGRDLALAELAEHSPLLVRFVERIKWNSLCEQPFEYVDRRYAELWSELVAQAHNHAKEPAA
jgi:hypothetical protein